MHTSMSSCMCVCVCVCVCVRHTVRPPGAHLERIAIAPWNGNEPTSETSKWHTKRRTGRAGGKPRLRCGKGSRKFRNSSPGVCSLSYLGPLPSPPFMLSPGQSTLPSAKRVFSTDFSPAPLPGIPVRPEARHTTTFSTTLHTHTHTHTYTNFRT